MLERASTQFAVVGVGPGPVHVESAMRLSAQSELTMVRAVWECLAALCRLGVQNVEASRNQADHHMRLL